MSKKHKKEKIRTPAQINLFFQKRSVIVCLFILVCLVGLPLRVQNIRLNGYISDDAWWHYRQVHEIVELGHRLNPDSHEFITLNRPMTYPPLFHYAVATAYKLFARWTTLITFTHYLNIFEAIFYLLLLYGISYAMTSDRLFSLIGMLAASVSYGMIIRARAAELMPFVLGDLLALAAILLLVLVLKDTTHKRALGFSLVAGVLLGLAMLSWSGSIFIYAPMILFAFLALITSQRHSLKLALKLFLPSLGAFLVVALPWYLPVLLTYGINPHSKEMDWFMKSFTVLHQVMPFPFYILTSGPAIFFVPIVFLNSLFKKDAVNKFFILWIILGAIATYTGWRGYVAVAPILAAVAISIGASRIVRFIFKEDSRYLSVAFIVLFLLVGFGGYYISSLRLKPLDPANPNEVRTNSRSMKMLGFLKNKYPAAISVDHITWVSEDAALGDLRMVTGQYLEYLPKGSSEAIKDISRIYLSEEEAAYQICQKYGAQLVIVRKHFLQLPQLSILFAPPELKSDSYLKITKEAPESPEVSISFSPVGMQTMLFKMLNRQPLARFELVYSDEDDYGPLPFVVVYRVKK